MMAETYGARSCFILIFFQPVYVMKQTAIIKFDTTLTTWHMCAWIAPRQIIKYTTAHSKSRYTSEGNCRTLQRCQINVQNIYVYKHRNFQHLPFFLFYFRQEQQKIEPGENFKNKGKIFRVWLNQPREMTKPAQIRVVTYHNLWYAHDRFLSK